MKAALLYEPELIEITETADPEIGFDEVMIKPKYAGICGSDVSLFKGHRVASSYPLLLGHEVVGHITAVGENVERFAVGQRVIVEPNFVCGVCDFCRTGRSNICLNKVSLGVTTSGCFAQQFVAPQEFVWSIPDTLDDQDAVVIEPLAVSLHALWDSGAQIGDTIAVIGCGATGLLLIQAAVAQGMQVYAHDVLESKLEMARRFGAQVDPNPDIPEVWMKGGVSTVFECAGISSTVELALAAVPRGGQVVLLGLSSNPASFTPLKFVREEIRVSGSIIYNHPVDFEKTISLVEKQVLSPKLIVTHTFPFQEIEQAMHFASDGDGGKVLLEMDN